MRKSAAMKKLEAYFKGMEAEYGEALSEYEFGWMAAQFGVAFRDGSMFGKGYVFTMIDLGREPEYAFILPGTSMEKAA